MVDTVMRFGWMAVVLAFFLESGMTRLQAQCTEAEAGEKPGTLILDQKEQAERNSESHRKPGATELQNIDRTVALLNQSLPDLRGIEGRYSKKTVDPAPGAHILHYSITAAFFNYYCLPAQNQTSPYHGQIRLADETGTWIYFYFNSMGPFGNESASLGREMGAANGRPIFILPKAEGEWKGHRLFLPTVNQQKSGAIILSRPGRSPFVPVSRDEFLRAREKVAQKYLDDAIAKTGSTALASKERQRQLDDLKGFLASMSSTELQSPAFVVEWSASPLRGRVFGTEASGARPLVTVDPAFVDQSQPQSAVQLIVVYWREDESVPSEHELIRQFKSNFNVPALEEMIAR